jgi:hypothetical protein
MKLMNCLVQGTKEDESSTGCIWAAGFHHFTAHSRLVGVLKLMNCLVQGTKEDESSTGHSWAAGFHHFTARSHLVGVLKRMNCFLSSIFKFLGAIESVDMGALL